MSKPITAYGFKGMNNLPRAPARLLDDERQLTPHIILNADVLDGGVLRRRDGYRRVIDLEDCHSIWAGSTMLCVADQVLYRVEGAAATALCEVAGPRAAVNYAEVNGLVYASNPYWTRVYNLSTGATRPWGVTLPPAPEISLVEGDLPPGAYSLCYTNVANGQLGGNGPLTQVAWEGGTLGIRLNNLPEDALAWITHPNGGKLFLAPVSGGVVSAVAPEIQPLPTFGVNPPPGFSHFVYAFGRIWGACGNRVFYSDPNQYEWFRAANFLPFLEDVALLAPVTGGMFVNSRKSSWYLEGTEPAKMVMHRVGDGAVPGTLALAQVEGGGYEISRKLSQMPSPVWMSRYGIVVGTHNGHLVHLTEGRVRFNVRSRGAGLYQVQDGIPRVVVSLHGVLLDKLDGDLSTILDNGRIFVPAPLNVIGAGGLSISGEGEVT